MTDCASLSERMPEVAHGRAAWSAAEASHLAACPNCAAEWRVILAAARLGAGIVVAPEPVAALVRRGLAEAPARRVFPLRAPTRWLVTLAAAAAILFVVWPRGSTSTGDVAAGIEAAAVLSELDGLTEAELEAVLDAMAPAPDAGVAPDPALRDLTDMELERVLRSLGG